MASAYDVSTPKGEQRTQRLVAAGLAAAWERTPVTKAHRRTSTAEEAAHGLAWGCRHAPAGQERWTVRRRADQMVACAVSASGSHATIRRTCKKVHCPPGPSKHGACHQRKRRPGSVTGTPAEISRQHRLPRSVPTCVWTPCRPRALGQCVRRSPLRLARPDGRPPRLHAMGRPTLLWLWHPAQGNGLRTSLRRAPQEMGRPCSTTSGINLIPTEGRCAA